MFRANDCRVLRQPFGSSLCWQYVIPAFVNSRYTTRALAPEDISAASSVATGHAWSTALLIDRALDWTIDAHNLSGARVQAITDKHPTRVAPVLQAQLRMGWPLIIVLNPALGQFGTGHVLLLGGISNEMPDSWSALKLELYDPEHVDIPENQPVPPREMSLGALWSNRHAGNRVYLGARAWLENT